MFAVILTSLALQLTSAAPSCVSRFSQMACGYHCLSTLAGLGCAQTPEGLCAASLARVACWDPPPDVRRLLAMDESIPRPTCITRGGSVACGFNCAATLSQAACADTPFGNCIARFGMLHCFDPPPEVRWQMIEAGRYDRAQCEATTRQISCGYHCVWAFGQVRCSQSPFGLCERRFDNVACSDPAPLLQAPSRVDPR